MKISKFIATALFFNTAMFLTNSVYANEINSHVVNSTAFTKVFPDGQKLTGLSIQFDFNVDNHKISPDIINVSPYQIKEIHVSDVQNGAKSDSGNYLFATLKDDNSNSKVFYLDNWKQTRRIPQISFNFTKDIYDSNNNKIPLKGKLIETNNVINETVDDFTQGIFIDKKTGDVLKYNLYIPKNYDPSKKYPIVLFMHDRGSNSIVSNTTLVQGLGAISWASRDWQDSHPSFVLAPQYDQDIANDNSETTSALDTTINLINDLSKKYNIDTTRRYTTGQSGGAMMSIAMNIKYPDFFAASYIVAGQWDATKVLPMKRSKLWIMVSEGDTKAYPGQNAITKKLEEAGAHICKAVWSGKSSKSEFNALAETLQIQQCSINYVTLKKGTVVPSNEEDNGGFNHLNTWRKAYDISSIKEWIFKQHN